VHDIASAIDDVPVIGPGGRVTVARSREGLDVDVVVRRRGRPIASSWRAPTEIAATIAGLVPRERLSVQAAFGYLELSKYEVQRLLRPVFLFLCTGGGGADEERASAAPRWAFVVAEPATTAPDVSLDDGLGHWQRGGALE
jgi:hypothetical protein